MSQSAVSMVPIFQITVWNLRPHLTGRYSRDNTNIFSSLYTTHPWPATKERDFRNWGKLRLCEQQELGLFERWWTDKIFWIWFLKEMRKSRPGCTSAAANHRGPDNGSGLTLGWSPMRYYIKEQELRFWDFSVKTEITYLRGRESVTSHPVPTQIHVLWQKPVVAMFSLKNCGSLLRCSPLTDEAVPL